MSVSTPSPSRTRQVLTVLLALALFGMGAYALVHMLERVNFADVRTQLRETPRTNLILAMLSTAVGYFALMGYDWWGLRFIGRRLPAGVVALGSFLGCAFGNTIGVSFISGGAVRYRIYSALGLAAFEVAALSSYIAVAMGIGLTLIGLAALTLHPTALGHLLPLPAVWIQLIAGVSLLFWLVLLYGYAWTGRDVRFRGYQFNLPSPKILTAQFGFNVLDILAASMTLWLLLPEGRPDFPVFVAIYAAATMVGVISHVPGGVGVFETAVLAAMPPSASPSDTAAALLLFRAIYFLLPFALAFVMVSLNEARSAGGAVARLWGRRGVEVPLRPVYGALRGVAPAMVAAVAFGAGLLLIAVALVPVLRADALSEGDLIGTILTEGGTVVAAVAGVVLLILSHGLLRRVEAAFWLTIAAIGAGVVASLLNEANIESAVILTLGGACMLPFRGAFYRHAKLTEGVFSPAWFALMAAVLVGGVSFFFFVHAATPWSNDLILDFSRDAATPRALRAGLLASALLLSFSVYLSLRPVRPRPAVLPADQLVRAAQIIAAHGRPSAGLALTGDKTLLFSDDNSGFIMYGRRKSLWVALGDPVGPSGCADPLVWEFFDQARRANGQPIFYEVGTENLPIWIEMGMSLHKIGEEAIVHLPDFSLSGAKFKTMRASFNKCQKSGLTCDVLLPPHAPDLIAELRGISDAWLADKTGKEKGFSVGAFDRDYLNHGPLAVVRRNGEAIAFANVLLAAEGRKVAIDLMRYTPEGGQGIMEFLFLSLLQHYREAGAEEFSLGVAPLSGLTSRPTAQLWNGIGRMIFRHGGAFYNFEGLRAFKNKFRPEWQPRYVVLPPGVLPVKALAEIALMISGGGRYAE